MRTPLDIDDEVLLAAKRLSTQRRVSTGKVLSELARRALTPKVATKIKNGVPLFPIQLGARPVTLELVNRLREQ
ncbi:MAG: CopG family transcriptional regulator [Acidobacteria bacterium]|nr:CopG family transcriptional regulator [Acidobacteriota bacterium]